LIERVIVEFGVAADAKSGRNLARRWFRRDADVGAFVGGKEVTSTFNRMRFSGV
jgi:hypothetical protein